MLSLNLLMRRKFCLGQSFVNGIWTWLSDSRCTLNTLLVLSVLIYVQYLSSGLWQQQIPSAWSCFCVLNSKTNSHYVQLVKLFINRMTVNSHIKVLFQILQILTGERRSEENFGLIKIIQTRKRVLCEIKSATWAAGKAINDLFVFRAKC